MTHYRTMEELRMSDGAWIGVDLDGTLAEYITWEGHHHIGKPIPRMVERVKQWIAEGKRVKVFTARVADPATRPLALHYISRWLFIEARIDKHLEVTHEKDFNMVDLWDDLAHGVDVNTGEERNDYEARFYQALVNAGVDNWEGYHYACEEMNGEDEEDDGL